MFEVLNNNPLLSGCFMIIMNLGGKYINLDIPNGMQIFFSHPWVRKLTIFAISYIATRNFETALCILLLFILCTKFLMNEKSKCCIPKIQKIYYQYKDFKDKNL